MKKGILIISVIFFASRSLLFGQILRYENKRFIDYSSIDKSVRPQDDFYHFANGNWITLQMQQNEPMIAPYISLYKDNEAYIDSLLKNLIDTSHERSKISKNLSKFYKSGYNQNLLDKYSQKSIVPYFSKIEMIQNTASLPIFFATNIYEPTKHIINIAATENDSGYYIATLSFSALNLPVDYYTNQASNLYLTNYSDYLKSVLQESGYAEQKAFDLANKIVLLEKDIAVSLMPNGQSNTSLVNISENKIIKKFFEALKVVPSILKVNDMRYLKELDTVLNKYPLEVWHAKLKTDYIIYNSKKLSSIYQNLFYEYFDNKLVSKKITKETREEYLISYMKNNLRESLGKLFVENRFTNSEKEQVANLYINLKSVLSSRIINRPWLNEQTKSKIIEKLNLLIAKIAYPDKWSTYTNINFSENNFFQNTRQVYQASKKVNIGLIDKKVNRNIWTFPVYGIGQSYSQTSNAFTIVAGYLQPPFYDIKMSDAEFYGGIGTTIAHEMTHAFDNNGRFYNGFGVKTNYWTQTDSINFEKVTNPIIKQYDGVLIQDSLNVNGKLTLGENIADLGGLAIAYEAFTKTMEYKSNRVLNGFTPEQRFFIAYAQRMVEKTNLEVLRWQLNQVWPPAFVRINETLKNFKPFQKAFIINEKDKMFQKTQNEVW